MLNGQDIQDIYDAFQAPVVAMDCGQRCSVHNGGRPFCCDDSHAIPVLYDVEFQMLRQRTDLWRGFRARNDHEASLRESLMDDSRFARCKGPSKCERDNRSITCRSFPFFPYLANDGAFLGLSYYWDFADRCWIYNKADMVEKPFVTGFFSAWERIFEAHPEEHEAYREFSAICRRVHTRKQQSFFVIDRHGQALIRRPGEDRLVRRGPHAPDPAPHDEAQAQSFEV